MSELKEELKPCRVRIIDNLSGKVSKPILKSAKLQNTEAAWTVFEPKLMKPDCSPLFICGCGSYDWNCDGRFMNEYACDSCGRFVLLELGDCLLKQRQLTKEELDIAPKWATNYTVVREGEIIFESKDFFKILKEGSLGLKFKQFSSGIQGSSQPIPRKAFDLSKVKWSEASDISSVSGFLDESLEVEYNYGLILYETKQDVINKAKSIGVTAEDFK